MITITTTTLLQTLILLLTAKYSTQSCASYSYDGHIYSLNCENIVSTNSINGYSSKGVHTIKISNSTITTIPENAFEHYKYELRNLILSGINLQEIERGALGTIDRDYFPHLVILDLSENQIQKLQVEVFNNSNVLELNLMSNGLEIIDVGAFRNMHKLRKLDLSRNKIHTQDEEGSFPLGVLQDTRTLSSLNVSHNFLEVIKLGVFTGLPFLKTLDLSHNNLVHLPKGLFVDCELIELYLNDNSLVFFEYPKNNIIPTINILNNDFNCDFLADMVSDLPKISFVKDQDYLNTNIKGVPCDMSKEEDEEYENNSEVDMGLDEKLSFLKYVTVATLCLGLLVFCYELCCKRSNNGDDDKSEPVLKEISYSNEEQY